MKILCIIQARMGSERLPGKVMKNIMGKPMITYTLDRVAKSKYIDEIVLATSNKDNENTMVEYLTEHNYLVFRGDENNVLKRYVDAANKHGGDIIIRITGDCPFEDPFIIDHVITYFLSNQYDYADLNVPYTMVRGFDFEIFTMEALRKTYEIVGKIDGQSPYKEHVTLYMHEHIDEFKISTIKGSELYQKSYRLCVDTKEDFELVTKIYEHFQDKYVSAWQIIKYLDDNKEIAAINANINQKHV